MIRHQARIFLISILILGCNEGRNKMDDSAAKNSVQILDYKYVNSHPHDTTAFTEGFLIHNGDLYESTGATSDFPQTRSLFGIVDLQTGKIDTKAEIDPVKYFGEGITILNEKVFQLTYKTKVGFIYDLTNFNKIGEFTFPSNEGWGLTTDGTNLIMSDGTDILTYLNPNTLQAVKTVPVSKNGYVINYLNELEYINGFIYANIWTTNTIVKINPADGKVVGELDLTDLANEAKSFYPGSLEMNGIAYDPVKGKVLVTGKFWPKIYEITFNH